MKKFVIYMSIFLSTIWIVVPRHNDPVSTTVGRASTRQPASSPEITVSAQHRPLLNYAMSVSKPVVVTTTTTTLPPTTTTTSPPPPPPTTVAVPVEPTGSVWDRLAQCESNGNWHINTGNGYYGGLQFSLSSWRAVGGTGYPHEHSRETQIEMGKRLHAQGGWAHWPACSRKLGLR